MMLAQVSSGFIFSTLNAVIYTVCFLVPGFLADFGFSRLISPKSEPVPLTLLRFLVFSCLNYIFWIFVYVLTLHWTKNIITYPVPFSWNKLIVENSLFVTGAFILVIFISPVVLGVILGAYYKEEWIEGSLSRLGMQTLSRFKLAWDYKFIRIDEPLWVLVTLKDGSRVAGKFGTNSLASSEPSEHDLYLEEVYKFDKDASWEPVPATSGIWIAGDEIRYIEFFKDQEEKT